MLNYVTKNKHDFQSMSIIYTKNFLYTCKHEVRLKLRNHKEILSTHYTSHYLRGMMKVIPKGLYYEGSFFYANT